MAADDTAPREVLFLTQGRPFTQPGQWSAAGWENKVSKVLVLEKGA